MWYDGWCESVNGGGGELRLVVVVVKVGECSSDKVHVHTLAGDRI